MLSRFMYDTMFASGNERTSATDDAPVGVTPIRMVPSTSTPAFRSDASSAPAANVDGSSTTIEYRLGAELEPIEPLTTMPFPARCAEIRPPLPGTRRTVLLMGIAVDAGSSSTTAFPFSGLATIQTRFSFNDKADTGAAYADIK